MNNFKKKSLTDKIIRICFPLSVTIIEACKNEDMYKKS